MDNYNTLSTLEGLTFTMKTNQVDGVSVSFELRNMEDSENVEYWRKYATDLIEKIATHFLTETTQIIFRVAATGNYQSSDSDAIVEGMTVNSNWTPKLHRHTADRSERIRKNVAFIFDPDHYHNTYQSNGGGSKIAEMVRISSIAFSFDFPYEFAANGLPASFRLHNGVLPINALKFLPYNTDNYCVMHSIFNKTNPIKTALNSNTEYMERFNTWFNQHNLGRFYTGDYFCLDNIGRLEIELETNLNVYTIEKKTFTVKGKDGKKKTEHENKPSLHYRSEYKQNIDSIVNLIIIPLDCFYDNNKAVPEVPKEITNGISIEIPQQDFIAKINVKEIVNQRKAHCGVLDTNVFLGRCFDGTKKNDLKVCRFCTRTMKPMYLEEHEKRCYASFHGVSEIMRARSYKELVEPEKVFKNYRAFYRTPFCTFDFETRLSEQNEHIPLSYSILYINLFDLKKSKKVLKRNPDPAILLEDFCQDLIDITRHHHDLQSVDLYHQADKEAAELPEVCPWCLKAVKEGAWDWNHTHYEFDNLNKHLDGYICHDCNVKATLKNTALKFYAHNGSRFDFNLILNKIINSPKFNQHQFLAKTESRFTQVSFNVKADTCLKISLNDSMMILGGSLSSLANAWIKPEDKSKVKDLLKLFYPENQNDINPLVDISLGKQVFPYGALNDPEQFKNKIIERDIFFNVLSNSHISDEDYAEYQKASGILEEYIGPDYSFAHYHDLYLSLDVILLGLILLNFSEVCYTMNELNPLAYLSISSYSFGALLMHNKYSLERQPTLMIPCVEVQKFLQRSIKGGFTHIFNKQIKNFDPETSVCSYLDVNSLYPSVMATVKLPYEFVEWIEGEVDEVLKEMEKLSGDNYFFCECDIGPLDEEFQDKVSRYPMFPETFTVLPEHLSEDQLYRYGVSHQKDFVQETINTVTFFEKKNYVCSYSYLKQAIAVGYKVTKIHQAARFKSAFIMGDYVKKIYELKRLASIEKDNLDKNDPEYKSKLAALESKITAYKLLLNGLYGSTIVNQEKHSETALFSVDDTEKLRKNISSFRYKSLLHLDKKVLVNKTKKSYQLEYPLMLGSAILFESKLIIAKWVFTLYDWLKKEFDLTFDAQMTDTDSYIFHIPNFKNCFDSIDQMCYYYNQECYSAFDTTFSEKRYQQPETHQAFCHFKNETKGVSLVEFNGIAPKRYSYRLESVEGKAGKECIKGKGIPAAMQKKHFKMDLDRQVIDGTILDDFFDEAGNANHVCEYTNILSKRTKLVNINVKKSFITLVDLKNHYGENGIEYSIFGSKKHLDQTAKPE